MSVFFLYYLGSNKILQENSKWYSNICKTNLKMKIKQKDDKKKLIIYKLF